MMAEQLLFVEMLFLISQSFITKTFLAKDQNYWEYYPQIMSILLRYIQKWKSQHCYHYINTIAVTF